ncbi:MAG: hypothetical protein FWH38_03575 [Treponema sp.]|nr:hypothetical protein [Treponema sp.]
MMVKKSGFCAALAFYFYLAAVLTAQDGGAGKPVAEQGAVIRVSGIVRLVGNDPFYELVITGANNEWYISGGEMHKLESFQNFTVTVEAVETVIPLKYASGRPAGDRRILSDIKIIQVVNAGS